MRDTGNAAEKPGLLEEVVSLVWECEEAFDQ